MKYHLLLNKSHPSRIEVVFRSLANRVGRHYHDILILHEDFCVLVARRPDSRNPEKLNRIHRVTFPLCRRALLKTNHTSAANDMNRIWEPEPC